MKSAIVVGAGAAGCSAAVNLVKSGWKVQLIEAKSFIGGRTYSFYDNEAGEEIDNGQHILIGAYKEFISIVDLLGNKGALKYQDSLNVVFRKKKNGRFLFDTSKMSGDLGKILALMSFPESNFSGKLKALRFAKKILAGKVEYKGLSALEVLKKYGQSQGFIESFWTPLITATINANPEDASGELFINVLKLGFLGKAEDSRLIIPTESLSALYSGLDKWLESHKSSLLLNNRISGLIVEDGVCTGVVNTDGDRFYGDAVILALPPEPLKKLIEPYSEAQYVLNILNKYKYSTIISIYLWLDREIMPEDFCALTGTTAQWVFNRRRLCSSIANANYPGHLTVTISAANKLEDTPNEELIEIIFDDLKSCFPEAAKAKLEHYRIIKDKRATFLANPEMEELRPENESPLTGLYFAGDWTKTGLPATIEGAARSGKCAAEKAVNKLINAQV